MMKCCRDLATLFQQSLCDRIDSYCSVCILESALEKYLRVTRGQYVLLQASFPKTVENVNRLQQVMRNEKCLSCSCRLY